LNSGGRGYYALDVTDPANPIALWEFSGRDSASCPSATVLGTDSDDCDLGLSYGNPVISKLTSGQWVVMVTSGYNNVAPGDGKGYLYVLDAITGVIEKKIKAANAAQSIDPGSTTSPIGLTKINNWVDNTNVDNTTLRVYAGDLEGNLWRFDPNAGSAYAIAKLTDASAKAQPVTTKPELGEANGTALVAVATGRYLGTSDLSDTQTQSVYTIKDATNGVVPAIPVDARSNSVVEQVMTDTTDAAGNPIRTITNNAVDLATKDGWRVDLPISGERVNVDPKLQLGTLIVASNVPVSDACTTGGYSYLNFFDYKSGSYIASSGINVVGPTTKQ
jgi:type IV pilus assembly protein PilY1